MPTEQALTELAPAERAPVEEALTEEALAPLIDRLLAESSLFHGIERHALAALLREVGHRLRLPAGADLITEGDAADAIYFIESGRFEVRKRSERDSAAADDGGHRIGQALPGAVVGEVALLDRGTRSATVRAVEESVALMLRVRDLEQAAERAPHPAVQMQLNLGRELAQKIRVSTSGAVRHLEEALHEERKRVEMGRFMSRVLIGTCLYMFALVLMQPLKALVPDSTAFSVIILLGFAFGLYLNIRTSMFPASAYGFTLAHWRPALREAALFSAPFLVLIVALKWALLQSSPAFAGRSLFDFYRQAGLGTLGTLAVVLAYALFVPIQEMVARSGIQSSLMMFLRPRHRVPMSIFMSTLLFSSTHLHTSLEFAVLVFPMGLFWGWLYSRHPTLVGVVFSHLLIGIWAVFVVSFPFF
ncbi:MAG: cyclic nucleotide-binding domain-containing protein [Burkholderiales bacterium]|nr:cyclic nucleotide-binding domain-containing protein [Burkholderiales bacterium]